MAKQVLIVDDEPLMCRSLCEVVKRAGHDVITAENGYEALDYIRQGQVSLIITDMNMPRMNGIEVLRKAKTIIPDISVVIITGYATIDNAVEAMKYGALDYITKPFSPSRINSIIDKAISDIDEIKELNYLPRISPDKIVTSDPSMMNILNNIPIIAQSDSSILIQGESGTGKELISRAIHLHSDRRNGPYVAINCAALPEGVLESELFGHEKGAFTGAISRRIGKIELAHGGTLLLDEVSEMPKTFQAKLLRAIQEREITRVGGNNQINANIRIIATTNRNILDEVDKGSFRDDLFYRLCVIPIFLPPLRERKDDIQYLAKYFAQKTAIRIGKKAPDISPEILEMLCNYSWPGNIRELENTIERAVVLCPNGSINRTHILPNPRKKSSKYVSLEVGVSIGEAEREIILKTLEQVKGNKQKAADILGITTKTIRNKLRQYGYDQEENEQDTGDE